MALTKVTGQVIKNTTDVTVGVLTVTNTLAVGGTVSIGGTLTYEDVTNVDAVGLITARDGIKVGSGITLSVDGDIFATGITTISENLKVGTGVTISPDGDGFFTGVITATSYSGIDLSAVTGATGDFSIADKIVHTGDTNTAIRFPSNDNISFEVAGTERLRIDDSDGVISKHTTAANLRIQNSTAASSQTATLDMAPANGVSGVQLKCTSEEDFSTGANRTAFFTVDVRKDGTFSEKLRILSNGNVLIGTTVDGNQALNVYGAANGAIAIQNSNTGTGADNGLYLGNGNSTIAYIWNYENDSMRFATNNTERMRITSNGNILIGNSNGGSEAINMVGGGGGILISRSTSSSPNDGQTLGDIGLNSYSASQTCSSADVLIRGQADGDHSGSSAGSALLLFTKPASTGPGSSATERLRINKSGAFGLAGANYGSAGQVLTSNGSGSAVSWAAAGGIGMAQHWRLTSSSQGNQTPLTSWEAADNSFAGSLGSSMSVSSGVFTYPSTGIYFVIYTLVGYSDSSTQNLIGSIQQSIDGGSNWSNAAYGLNGIYDYSNSYPSWGNTATHYIFDITDTSQQKTRFIYGAGQGPEYAKGDTNITYTGVTFIRLGDT